MRWTVKAAVASAFGFVLTAYAPLLVDRLSRSRALPVEGSCNKAAGEEASVVVIIPAYLEANVIAEKVASTRLALGLWPGPTSIVVSASDAATAEAASDADLVIRGERRGKPFAINEALARVEADVVILTDANCEILPHDWVASAICALNSSDLVSCRKAETAGQDDLFWKYENALKDAMTRGSTPAVAGEFMAFRKSDFSPIPEQQLLDDLWMALDFNRRGLRVSLAPGVRTIEPASVGREQWDRRVRIAEGILFQILPRYRELLQSAFGRRLLAHKVGRATLGPVLFWSTIGFAAIGMNLPGASLLLLVAAASVAQYRGDRKHSRDRRLMPAPLATLFGLQAVPIAAVFRGVRRASSRSVSVGWAKVPR